MNPQMNQYTPQMNPQIDTSTTQMNPGHIAPTATTVVQPQPIVIIS